MLSKQLNKTARARPASLTRQVIVRQLRTASAQTSGVAAGVGAGNETKGERMVGKTRGLAGEWLELELGYGREEARREEAG